MGSVRRPEVLVYFEGIRLDWNTLTIRAGVNQPSTCHVTLPPVVELLDLLPRTLVQVFFRDYFDETGVFEDDFRLMWEGEFTGFTINRAPDQWHMTLECQDLSNYWSYSYGLFEPGVSEGLSQLRLVGQAVDAQNVKFTLRTGRTFTTRRIQILASNKDKAVDLALRSYLEDSLSLTPWFRIHNRRLKLAPFEGDDRGRVRVLPDPEVRTLFQSNLMSDVLDMAISQVTSYMTLRQVIARFTEFFFYQTWPVISPPPLVKEQEGTSDETERLLQFLIKPTTYFSAPAPCNVFWPDDIITLNYAQDHLSEPTRLHITTMPTGTALQAIPELIQAFSFDPYAPALLADLLFEANVRRTTAAQSNDPASVAQAGAGAAAGKGSTTGQISQQEIDEAAAELRASGKILLDDRLEDDIRDRLLDPWSLAPALVLSDPDLPIESREDLKGAIPMELPLTNYAWFAAFKESTGQRAGNYLRRLADYYLALRQHQRQTSVTIAFNPYVLLGFPAVALDRVFPIFGEVASIEHTITPDHAMTTLSMIYSRTGDAVRYVDKRDRIRTVTSGKLTPDSGDPKPDNEFESDDQGDPKFSRLKPDRDLPFWINQSYLPEFIGEESFEAICRKVDDGGNLTAGEDETRSGAYRELFGIGSIFSRKLSDPDDGSKLVNPGVDDDGKGLKFSQLETARLLVRIRDAKKDTMARAQFEDGFRKRPVITMKETLAFIGATIVNRDELVNDTTETNTDKHPYRDEVRVVVRKIRKALVEQVRVAGT